jgi:hypothetical protein
MTKHIVPIVEGIAEVESVPVLMRRLLHQWGKYQLEIEKPVRVKRNQVVKQDELERRVIMAMNRPNCRGIVVILDSDDDCPKELAPELLERAKKIAQSVPVSVILPKSELESWFVGSIESLRGLRGISASACSPSGPEDIRDAKGYLTKAMEGSQRYLEVDDQPAFAERFDLDQALAKCRSFRKFYCDFRKIADALT